MCTKKSKFFLRSIILFLMMLISFPSFAAEAHLFTTPYYRLQLDSSMQQLKSYAGKMDNHTPMVAYMYGSVQKDIEASLTIEIITLPSNAKSNFDRFQRQFIAGMVNGLQKRFGSDGKDKFTVFNQVKTVRLNDREFKSYDYNLSSGKIEMFTTINKNKLYSFIIACYGHDAKNLNEISQSLVTQMSKIKFN